MKLQIRILIGIVVSGIVSAALMHLFVVHHQGAPITGGNTHVYVTSMVLVFATTVLVLSPVQRWFTNLEHTAKRLRDGDLSARVDVKGHSSIARVGTHINDMAEEIQRLMLSQRELTQAVSHEFRTPIARLRFVVELLEHESSQEQRTVHFAEIDDNLTELDTLVEELLTFTRLEHSVAIQKPTHSPAFRTERLTPELELKSLLKQIEGTYPNSGIVLNWGTNKGVATTHLVANTRYFRRAMENLILNAIRHASELVVVTMEVEAASISIHVDDDGPGVAIADRVRIWEAFARLDDSRNRANGGTGLGLAIVKRILIWHEGSVAAGDSPLGGARFTTRWPTTTNVIANP